MRSGREYNLGVVTGANVINVNNWLTRANEILQQSVSTATAGEKIAFATSFLLLSMVPTAWR